MTLRDKINEVIKDENNPWTEVARQSNSVAFQEVIEMIYVIYKDIEKIKNHLGIK